MFVRPLTSSARTEVIIASIASIAFEILTKVEGLRVKGVMRLVVASSIYVQLCCKQKILVLHAEVLHVLSLFPSLGPRFKRVGSQEYRRHSKEHS